MSRRTFAVGRVDRKTTEIRLLRAPRAAIRGPFTVRAVTRTTSSRDVNDAAPSR